MEGAAQVACFAAQGAAITLLGTQFTPLDALLGSLKLVNTIWELAQQVEANKKQCLRLASRIGTLEAPLRALQSRIEVAPASGASHAPALADLHAVLTDAHTFVDGLSAAGNRGVRWLRSVAMAYTWKADMEMLYQRLDTARGDLNFAVCADTYTMALEDKSDAEADFQDLQMLLEKLYEDIEANADARHEQQQLQQQQQLLQQEVQHQEVVAMLAQLRSGVGEKLVGFAEIRPETLDYSAGVERRGGLGKGSFGIVRRATYCGAEVAVKTLLTAGEDGGGTLSWGDVHALRREVEIHSNLRFPHVVHLLGACTVLPDLCMVMELAPHGSLHRVLHSPGARALRWEAKVAMLWDVARGTAFIHSERVMHRDLKSANVLVFANYQAKLCDFGLAKVMSATTVRSTKTTPGTYAWMAPEVMHEEPYTPAADVYSAAMIMYEALAGCVPFADKGPVHIIKAVLNGQRPPLPPADPLRLGAAAVDALTRSCWEQDPRQRPSSDEMSARLAHIVREIGGDVRARGEAAALLDPMSALQPSVVDPFATPQGSVRSTTATNRSPAELGSDAVTATVHVSQRSPGRICAGPTSPSVVQVARPKTVAPSSSVTDEADGASSVDFGPAKDGGSCGGGGSYDTQDAGGVNGNGAGSDGTSTVADVGGGGYSIDTAHLVHTDYYSNYRSPEAPKSTTCPYDSVPAGDARQGRPLPPVPPPVPPHPSQEAQLLQDQAQLQERVLEQLRQWHPAESAHGLCGRVLELMESHAMDAAVAAEGCRAVARACEAAVRPQREDGGRAPRVVLAAMRMHEGSAEVAEAGAYACARLIQPGSDLTREVLPVVHGDLKFKWSRGALFAAGACGTLPAVMRAHAECAAVQVAACQALFHLATGFTGMNTDVWMALERERAAEAVGAALHAFEGDREVMAWAGRAAYNMASSHSGNQRAFAELDVTVSKMHVKLRGKTVYTFPVLNPFGLLGRG